MYWTIFNSTLAIWILQLKSCLRTVSSLLRGIRETTRASPRHFRASTPSRGGIFPRDCRDEGPQHPIPRRLLFLCRGIPASTPPYIQERRRGKVVLVGSNWSWPFLHVLHERELQSKEVCYLPTATAGLEGSAKEWSLCCVIPASWGAIQLT